MGAIVAFHLGNLTGLIGPCGHRRIALMKLGGILALSAALVMTGCSHTPPPVSERVQRYYDESQVRQAAVGPQPVAAFLGDSYTAASQDGGGYIGPLATAMGWTPAYFGQGGTGYVNPGQVAEGETAFPERVQNVIASAPDVVVVQGGINDNNRATTLVAASRVFGDLRAGLPRARIVAVGPVMAPGMSGASISAARDGIKEAADTHGVTFIDPIAEGWLPTADLFDAAGVHPTAEGYKRLGDSLALAMKAQGIAPAASR